MAALVDLVFLYEPAYIRVHGRSFLLNLLGPARIHGRPSVFKAPVDEIVPLPGLTVNITLLQGRSVRKAKLQVSEREADVTVPTAEPS